MSMLSGIKSFSSWVVGFLAWLGLACPAVAAERPPVATSSPLQQARQTGLILRQLSAAHPGAPAAAPATSSTAARAAARTRPTTVTVTLRPKSAQPGRPALPWSMSAAASASLARRASRPARPDLARLLAMPDLAPPLDGGTPVTLPAIDPAWLAPVRAAVAPPPPPVPARPPAAGLPVQVNSADERELRARLGVDGIRARNIVEFRTHYGPFKCLDDLSQVNGITQEMVKKWDDRNLLLFK